MNQVDTNKLVQKWDREPVPLSQECEVMDERIRQLLLHFRKKTISMSELEKLFSPFTLNYDDFATRLLALEDEGTLEMVKAKGRTSRTPSLAYQYRINKSLLTKDLHQQLQKARLELHPSIHIDHYFSLDETKWKRDYPYLVKINQYIRTYGFPIEQAPAPERSFELVGDEKWIVEKEGKELLEGICLWDTLKIILVSDPLMFAINPLKIHDAKQLHLIVENKTTYQGLLPILVDTNFSTLIYGSGNKIPRSIEQFSSQYPVQADHVFYYFGDLDRSGIQIWHSLSKKQAILPAMPFYRACLKKSPVSGKEYQYVGREALHDFLNYFTELEKAEIQSFLKKGLYYPQEVLKTLELKRIWRESEW